MRLIFVKRVLRKKLVLFQINVRAALGVFSLQNLGIIVGIGCLYTLAKFQV